MLESGVLGFWGAIRNFLRMYFVQLRIAKLVETCMGTW